MSKPVGYSISSELISAMSSLNMTPSPIPPSKKGDVEVYDGLKFLPALDYNVKHSMEHLSSVFDISKELKSELDDIKRYVMKDMQYSDEWEKLDKMFRKIERRL